MGKHIVFEIARCANPSACKQQVLMVTDPDTGMGVTLTGTCGGPHRRVKAYMVDRKHFEKALRHLGLTRKNSGSQAPR